MDFGQFHRGSKNNNNNDDDDYDEMTKKALKLLDFP